MSVCPNCGTSNNGGKFCCNCGTPLPAEEPVQNVQPAVQPVAQPAPVQPEVQPVAAPAPVQPVAAPVQVQQEAAPVVQPVYQQPEYQSAAQASQTVYAQAANPETQPKEKANGMCKVGFILSLVGIITFALTSLFGLIFSIVGLIQASSKKQKGKGLAVAGIIISVVLMGIVGFASYYVFNEMDKYTDPGFIIDTTKETTAEDEDDKTEIITKTNWVEKHDGSYLVFEKHNSFKYYQSVTDTSNYYYTGKYELYFGDEAIDVITNDYEEAGVTEDEIKQMYTDKQLKNLVVLILKNDGCWVDGENTRDEAWTTVYLGYFQEKNGYEIFLINVSTATDFDFIPEDEYEIPVTATTTTEETTMPTETVETTAATSDTSETTVETSQTSDYSGYEAVGDDISGYVYLTQGTWADWTESGINRDDYAAIYQKINMETMTIFNLSVYSGQYTTSNLKPLAEALKANLESDTGYSGVTMEETTFGGYKAYSIRGQYQDGMYLNVWLFVDKNGKLHYNSIEYFDSDIASYNMFVETYTLN